MYIFLSPSSVNSKAKSAKRGNAQIHNMTSVTIGSIAYVATQVSMNYIWISFAVGIDQLFTRSALLCLWHLFFLDPIWKQILRHSITPFIASWMTLRRKKTSTNCSSGITCKYLVFAPNQSDATDIQEYFSHIFYWIPSSYWRFCEGFGQKAMGGKEQGQGQCRQGRQG